MKLSKNAILYITIIGIFLISSYAGLADMDYYWQVDLGKNIINSGDFNAIYKQCWGTKGVSTYYDHEWLTNILFYFSSLVGVKGITICKIFISLFLSICCILYIKFEDKKVNLVSFVGVVVFLLLISSIFVKVKAYTISIGFLILEVLFLKGYERYKARKYFVYMLILCILWTNMHSGSVPLFFGTAGVFWLTRLRRDKLVPVVGIGCLLSTCINPYGYKLMLFNLMHNGDRVMKKYVLDWRPLDAKEFLGVGCVALLFIVIFSLYKIDIKENAFDVIMIFIIMFMGLESVRHLIYLTPFFISMILRNKFSRELSLTFAKYVMAFCVGVSILCNFSAFTCKNYKQVYGMDYVDDKLKQLLLDTNKDSCDGLFTADVNMWSLGLKSFGSGAFPCTRQRFLDSYLIMYSGSNQQIKQVIDYYGLNRFVFAKNNILVDYYVVDNVLYDYLRGSKEYECVYDSNFYCYFIRKDLVK